MPIVAYYLTVIAVVAHFIPIVQPLATTVYFFTTPCHAMLCYVLDNDNIMHCCAVYACQVQLACMKLMH